MAPVTERNYDIFKFDNYGDCEVSKLVDDKNFEELKQLLKASGLSEEFHVTDATSDAKLLSNLVIEAFNHALDMQNHGITRDNLFSLKTCVIDTMRNLSETINDEVFLAGGEGKSE